MATGGQRSIPLNAAVEHEIPMHQGTVVGNPGSRRRAADTTASHRRQLPFDDPLVEISKDGNFDWLKGVFSDGTPTYCPALNHRGENGDLHATSTGNARRLAIAPRKLGTSVVRHASSLRRAPHSSDRPRLAPPLP